MNYLPVVVRMDLEDDIFITPGAKLEIDNQQVKVLRIRSVERHESNTIVIFEAARVEKQKLRIVK